MNIGTRLWFVALMLLASVAHSQTPVFDLHVHLWKGESSLAEYEAQLKRAGQTVAGAGVMWFGGPNQALQGHPEQIRTHNDGLIALAAAHPKLMPIATVHPYDGAAAVAELERVAARGVKVLKLHPHTQKFDAADPRVLALVKRAGELGVIVLFDNASIVPDDCEKLFNLALDAPKTKFIFAHLGGLNFRFWNILKAARTAEGLFADNIYFDISATVVIVADSPLAAEFAWTIRNVGIDHVLLGSDFPQYSLDQNARALERLSLDEQEKKRIRFENAQQLFGLASPTGSPAQTIVSPVVAEGKVTFRLRAAEAKAVTVSGDFGPDVALSRDTEGVWSATVGPLKPDEYVYYFIVDGVRLPDPVNPQVKIGYVPTTTTSLVNVPGEGPQFYDVQDVPHGEIRTLLYKSQSNAAVRELNVYLPPGYEASSRQRYPVLYLLHGYANDHHSWHRYGRANDILDNLLATKAIEPFIVVMPLGYGGAAVNGDGNGIPAPGAGAFGGDFALYERDILQDVIPLIDGKYRTLANREHRAIIGFSMGGMQAGRFGLGHLDTFSYVGIMSAGLIGNPVSAAAGPDPIAPLAANPAATNKQLKLLWIACGVDDTAMVGARSTHEALQKAGIQHVFVESEGAHHWRVWRRYLRDVAPLLFR